MASPTPPPPPQRPVAMPMRPLPLQNVKDAPATAAALVVVPPAIPIPTQHDVAAVAAAAATTAPALAPLELPPANKRPAEDSKVSSSSNKRSRMKNTPWNDMLFELLKFRARKGHCNVPYGTGPLGRWVVHQRGRYQAIKEGKLSEVGGGLTPERMEVLNSIGFVWDTVQYDLDARWQKRFNELVEYKQLNGHCNVPQSQEGLGTWVKMQRECKKEADLKAAGKLPCRSKPRPCLSKERMDKLDTIGFQWRIAKPVTGWDNRYEQLREYKRLHGDCNVPQAYPPDKPFGRWVMKQRCEYSLKLRGEKSQLTEERIERLNTLGFSWVAPNFRRKTVPLEVEEQEGTVLW